MSEPILDTVKDGSTPRHHSVGAVIVRDRRYLLIDRAKPPYGFAGLAGHIDIGEDAAEAIVREVGEESGLCVIAVEELFVEEISKDNTCGYGVTAHFWTLFRCITEGEPVLDVREAKSMGWFDAETIRKMANQGLLEPVWKHWFIKLGVIA